MPLIEYTPHRFSSASRQMIDRANTIIVEYARQGFQLTLRQLYYQFVSRDYCPNNLKSYKNLGNIINDGRLSGDIDWNSIVDRTRNLIKPNTWGSPAEIVSACAQQYKEDLWDYKQNFRPEVWIEKDALVGVIENVCAELRIPYFSCRGFTSQSEMWSAAMRLVAIAETGQTPHILHFGDHDPSGMDMSRDIEDRLALFGAGPELIQFNRMALNTDQVKKYRPPPNPAKNTDSRFAEYRKKFGVNSWELDALEPSVIASLIENEVLSLRDDEAWDEALAKEEVGKEKLRKVIKKLEK